MSREDVLVSKVGGNQICSNTESAILSEKEVIGGNIITDLHNKEKVILIEKKVLEGEESRLDGNLTTLFEDTFKSLRTWNNQLKSRERSLVTKADRLNNFIKRTREIYGIFSESGDEEVFSEKPGGLKNDSSDTDDLLDEVPIAHLTHEDSCHEEPKVYENQRTYIPDYCTDSHSDPEDNAIRKKQMKEGKLVNKEKKKKQMKKKKIEHGSWKNDTAMLKKNDLEDDVPTTLNKGKNAEENEIGAANSWTVAKIQRLYMKYCRAESFRKALAYQKRYLTIMAYEGQRQAHKVNDKPKASLKVVACAVIAIIRMKYLVKRYHRRLQMYSTSGNIKRTKSRKKKRIHDVYKSSDEEGNESLFITNAKKEIQSTPVYLTNGDSNATKAYNNRLSDSIDKQLHTNEITNKRISYATGENNIDILPSKSNIEYPNPPIDNMSSDEAANVYQSNDFISQQMPSKIYGSHSMLNSYPRCITKAPYMYAERPLSPELLLTTISYDYEDNMHDDADESLSYMRTLHALQMKLKRINDKTIL